MVYISVINTQTFQSIWLELSDVNNKNTNIAGYYREWNHEGDKTEECQIEQINTFASQIDLAATSGSNLIITGDVNLCSNKWDDSNYTRKNVANPLKNCIVRNGLDIHNIGNTYMADRILPDDNITESAIDHVYSSKNIRNQISAKTLETSSSDHLPVVIDFSTNMNKPKYSHKITKRSYKHFTPEKWNNCLAIADWSKLEQSSDVNEMTVAFTKIVTDCLDKVAPIKTFTIKSNYKFGLSDEVKTLMKKRDSTRQKIKHAII